MSNIKTEKATSQTVAKPSNNKFAHAGKSVTARGSNNVNTKISLGADADAKYDLVPPQCRVIYQLLALLGGTATIGELQDFGMTDSAIKAGYAWREGEDKKAPNVDYTQSIGEVFNHYNNKGLTGNAATDLTKAGVCEFFRIVS